MYPTLRPIVFLLWTVFLVCFTGPGHVTGKAYELEDDIAGKLYKNKSLQLHSSDNVMRCCLVLLIINSKRHIEMPPFLR